MHNWPAYKFALFTLLIIQRNEKRNSDFAFGILSWISSFCFLTVLFAWQQQITVVHCIFVATWAWWYKQPTSSHCGSVTHDSWYGVAFRRQWWMKNITDNWILFTFGRFKSLITIGSLKDSRCHGTDCGHISH